MQVEEIVCYYENLKMNLLSYQDRRVTVQCSVFPWLGCLQYLGQCFWFCSDYTSTQFLIQVAEPASGNLGVLSHLFCDLLLIYYAVFFLNFIFYFYHFLKIFIWNSLGLCFHSILILSKAFPCGKVQIIVDPKCICRVFFCIYSHSIFTVEPKSVFLSGIFDLKDSCVRCVQGMAL